MSKGVQVLEPSLAKIKESGRSRRSASRVAGVRVRRAKVSDRLWGMLGLDWCVREFTAMGILAEMGVGVSGPIWCR